MSFCSHVKRATALAGGSLLTLSFAFGSADGINLMNTSNARVDHVFVTATDDALCIKARNFDGPPDPDPARNVRNILTSHAVVYQSGYRGTKIGTETAAQVFEDIIYENINIASAGSGMANSIYLTDSAEIRDFVYRNFYAEGNNWNAAKQGFAGRLPQATSRINHITLRNVVSNNIRFAGHVNSDYLISDVSITNFWRSGSLTTNASDLVLDELVDADTITLDANPVYALDFVRPVESSRHMLPGLLYIEAHVRHDNDLPMTVEFFADGVSIGTAVGEPYAIEWEAPEGWHNLTYTVSDAAGNTDTLATPRRVEVRSEEVFAGVRVFSPGPLGPETEILFLAYALNQYGEVMFPQPDTWTWSADSGGSFADPLDGVFLSNSDEGTHTIRVSGTLDGITFEGVGEVTIVPELTVTETTVASGKEYEWDVLEAGALRYIDRTATFSSVGDFAGMLYLRNANDDRGRRGIIVSFRLSHDATIYVAVNNQFDTSLDWFSGYTPTLKTLAGHEVYQQFFPAGSLIAMGENRNESGGTNFNMYHIIVDHTPPPPNQPPEAALTAAPISGDPPMLVSFDASASSDPDGVIVRYDWDFGDGTVQEDGPAQVSHTYTTIGTFTATVTVTDNEGATDTAVVFISTTGAPVIPVAFQFNFGDLPYTGSNSPAHAESALPSSLDTWQTVSGNTATQEIDVSGVPFSATVHVRRANGDGANAAVSLTQGNSISNRSQTGSGVFGTNLTQSWSAYSRGGFPGRSVGAWFTGLTPGEYDVYAIVHNPTLIDAGRTTNVGIGVGAATSGNLAWNDPSLTGTSFAASPQTDTWELGVNYARVRVEVTAENPIVYVIQGGPAAANDEFDYHTLTAVQIVAVSGDEPPPSDAYADWVLANSIQGGPADTTGGVANLMRYALGGDASTPSSELLPQVQSVLDPEGLVLSLTFERINDPQVSYAVWYSEDLDDWGSEPVWQDDGAHGGVPGPFEVTVPTSAERGFLRLEVSR
jgi:PKD repeat protein